MPSGCADATDCQFSDFPDGNRPVTYAGLRTRPLELWMLVAAGLLRTLGVAAPFLYTAFEPSMTAPKTAATDYDTVELRTGRLQKIRLSHGRKLGDDDRMVRVVKCYCRSHDVITSSEAEMQIRPTFVFPEEFFRDLETLIGKELEGRIYSDSGSRRVRFYLDLKEHAGFPLEEGNPDLQSPWYDDSVLKE